MAKYNQLSDLLRRRILNGDYAIKGLPAERQLALEHGVAHMTARRVLLNLQEEGILVRGVNGRLEINRATPASADALQIAFLAPLFNSHAIDRWSEALEAATESFGGRLRRFHYRHWEDPMILESLKGFDGRFILPCSEVMPPQIIEQLLAVKQKSPVVMLSDDLSGFGIPSISHIPPTFVQKLLRHLEAQGHERIACLNVQPHDKIIEARIAQWRNWTAARRLPATLIDDPVKSFQDPFPRAYEVMCRLLAEKAFTSSALFCTTYAAAVGAMRALHEHRLRPGIDVAIGLVDGEGQAAYQIPSLTALEPPDVVPQLTVCLQWIARGGGDWQGQLLLQPEDVPLVVRESTSTPLHSGLNSMRDVLAGAAKSELALSAVES